MTSITLKNKKIIKRTIKYTLAFILCGLVFICFSIYSVKHSGEKYITDMKNLPSDIEAIIVLGAGVKDDGTASDILIDRLETSLEVKNQLKESKFLMSGDHGREEYNEVRTMKNFALKNNVAEKEIFMDHAGFNTYDSMYRAKNIFNVKKAIVITNEYHLPRALYIANKMGIEAYGIKSDKRNYYFIEAYKKRERLAQIKAFIDVNILKRDPKFLGEPIPISGDGRQTEDDV